jgi:hypothetical protein
VFGRKFAVLVLASAGLVRADAFGQRPGPRLAFYVVPPSPKALGQQLTLGVRPPTPATTYRYVATQRTTGGGRLAASVGCAAPQTIGTGHRIQWTPASGTYRLTVHSLTRLQQRDSSSVSYDVNAPVGGWLNISVTQTANPSPAGKVTLQLSTNDRGAGHGYQWIVRFQSVVGALPMLDYSSDSPGPTLSVPLILTPATYKVTARVGVRAGNPCEVMETSNGTLASQVVR